MKYTQTIEWNIDDLPHEVVNIAAALKLPIKISTVFEQAEYGLEGEYRLRVHCELADDNFEVVPEENPPHLVTDFENLKQYDHYTLSCFDGSYNWDTFQGKDTAQELLRAYVAAQKALYPDAQIEMVKS